MKYSLDTGIKPIIGITMGDPAGIGPEITLKALNKKEVTDICRPLIIGDVKVIEAASAFSQLKVKLRSVKSVDEAVFDGKAINVYDLNNVNLAEIEYGKVSAHAGCAAYQAVEKVIQLVLNRREQWVLTLKVLSRPILFFPKQWADIMMAVWPCIMIRDISRSNWSVSRGMIKHNPCPA